jgi:hypothetical protein
MAGTTSCRTCGQVNADGTEYCVRCGTRMPDPSSTQLVGPGGAGGAPEYPWEPPAEWDPGELPAAGGQPPAPTWVANTPADQVGWNTGHDTGSQPPGYPPTYPPAQPPTYPPTAGAPAAPKPAGSRKALWIGATAVVVIAAIVAVVLVAGGGKKKNSNGGGTQTAALNGVQNESGTDALASAREALRAAGSAQITGTVLDAGQPIRLDLTLAAGDNSAGTLTINNADVQLIKVGQTVFIKGDMDFLKKYAGNNTAVLNQLNGKWLKTTTTTDFDLFTLDGFAGLLKGGTGSSAVVPKVTQSTLNGQKTVVVSQQDGSTLTIANTGPAVPLKLDAKGNNGGTLTFTNYNKSNPITAPPASEVFDISSASGGTLTGAYTCTGSNDTSGGTLTLASDNSYTVTGGAAGGSWGSSGDQVAFAGGALDKYAATWNRSDTLNLKGSGANANVTFTCVKQ